MDQDVSGFGFFVRQMAMPEYAMNGHVAQSGESIG